MTEQMLHTLYKEAEFLDAIGEKVLRVFLLAIHIHLYYGFCPTPPWSKSDLKLVCNVNIICGNLKSENPQDYAQKPQRNYTFMNSASLNTCPSLSLYILVIDEAKDTRWTRENRARIFKLLCC